MTLIDWFLSIYQPVYKDAFYVGSYLHFCVVILFWFAFAHKSIEYKQFSNRSIGYIVDTVRASVALEVMIMKG